MRGCKGNMERKSICKSVDQFVDTHDKFMTFVKAAVAAVPYAGGSINSLINDYQTEVAKKKSEEFFAKFREEMETKMSEIKDDTVSSEDFATVFCNTYNDILRAREEQKRAALRHILINTALSAYKEIDFDKTEKIERLVRELPIIDIIFLVNLSEEQKSKTVAEDKVRQFCDDVMEKIGITDKEKRLEIITDLETSGIIKDYGISNQSVRLVATTTDSREREINLITQLGEDLLNSINLE